MVDLAFYHPLIAQAEVLLPNLLEALSVSVLRGLPCELRTLRTTTLLYLMQILFVHFGLELRRCLYKSFSKGMHWQH